MTLPTHIQKAAEEAAERSVNRNMLELIEADGRARHFRQGVQWLYDFLLKDAPEFDGMKVKEMEKNLGDRYLSFREGARWQHEQSSAQISALKLELAEKDQRIAELEGQLGKAEVVIKDSANFYACNEYFAAKKDSKK